MIGVLHSTLTHVGHVTVSTGDTTLSVDTHTPEFVVGVLSLEYGSTRELVRVVGVIHLIVVGFDILDREALVMREGEVHAVALEVVLSVALSTDERAHILVRLLGDILPTACPRFVERRARRLEVHSPGVVTVGAADGVHDLVPPLTPGSFVELCDTFLLHDAGDIRTLTSPAGTWLYVLIAVHPRGTRAKDLAHIFDGVLVSAWGIVLHSEGVACP